jgi:hypothetical protein
MDWGCWREISSYYLPGQTILSIMMHKERKDLINICREMSIAIPGVECIEEEMAKTKPVFFSSKDVIREVPPEERASYGPKYNLLYDFLFGSTEGTTAGDEEDGTSTQSAKKKKKKKSTWYKRLPDGEIDYDSLSSCIAVRPEGKQSHLLSNAARGELKRIAYGTVDEMVKPLFYGEALSERVEVVEIIDINNPAYLYCLPDEKPYSIIAKRDFKKDDAVLCYGWITRMEFQTLILIFLM